MPTSVGGPDCIFSLSHTRAEGRGIRDREELRIISRSIEYALCHFAEFEAFVTRMDEMSRRESPVDPPTNLGITTERNSDGRPTRNVRRGAREKASVPARRDRPPTVGRALGKGGVTSGPS